MAERGLGRRLTFAGHVSGERARLAWSRADAFVLPSYSEGFSMAILEALAARKPVLITTACHFPDVAREDAGIVVEPNAPSVTRGLRELLNRSADQRRALGERGRQLVETHYTWHRQAERLAQVYRWMAGGGTAPDCVHLAP